MPNFSNQRKATNARPLREAPPPQQRQRSPAAPGPLPATPVAAVRPKRRYFSAGLLLAVPAATALALFAYLQWWPESVSRRWEARLATCADAEVPAHIESLTGCGAHGSRALVRLLASPRANVAESAHQALAASLRQLTAGDDPADADAALVLAEAMEQLVATTTAGVPEPAAALAWEVLEAVGRLGLDARLPKTTRGRLLVACNTLLERPTLAPSTAGSPAQNTAARAAQTTAAGKVPAQGNAPLPLTPAEIEPRVSAPAPTIATLNSGAIPATPSTASPPVPQPLRSAANASARVNPIRAPLADQQIQQASTAAGGGLPPDSARQAAAAWRGTALQTRTAWSLFESLGSAQDAIALAELHRRGFTDREIELGRHLTSPDADERLRYTQLMPSLAGSSLKPWLLHLSADPDAEVRRACVAIMAANNDPSIVARVREMAFTDGDEEVRLQASRLLDQSGRRQ